MQHTKRMRHIISPSVACLAVTYFSTSSHTRHDFREEGIEHEMCFDFLYNSCLKRFSFEEVGEILSQLYIGLQVNYPLFLPCFNET
jgi:hypothetical protein